MNIFNKIINIKSLPIIIVSVIGGMVICKTIKAIAYPKISIDNIDSVNETFDYSIDGGSYRKFELGKIVGESNVNGTFGLKVLISSTSEGFILTAINPKGKASVAVINSQKKEVIYS